MNLKLAAAAVLISLYLIYRTHRKQEALRNLLKNPNTYLSPLVTGVTPCNERHPS